MASRILKNSAYLFVSQVAGKVIAFVFIIYAARTLGSSGFGVYSFVTSFMMIPAVIASFGMDTLLIREVARDQSKYPLYVSNIVILRAGFSLLLAAAMAAVFFCTGFIPSHEKRVYLAVYSATILFSLVQQTLWAATDAHQEMQYHGSLFILWNFLRAAFGLYALVGGYGLAGVFIGLVAAEILGAAAALFVTVRKFPVGRWSFDAGFARGLVRASVPFWATQVAVAFYQKIDTVMLAMIQGDSAAGYYNAANNLMMTLLFIPVSVTNAVYPYLSRFSEGARDLMRDRYEETLKYLVLMGFPLAAGVTVLSDRIIGLLYGAAFAASAPVLKVLIWSLALSFMNSLLGAAMLAVNREKQYSMTILAAVAVNLALNIALIPRISCMGASAARVAFDVILLVVFLKVLSGVFGRLPFSATYLKLALNTLVMTAYMTVFSRMQLVPLAFSAAAVYLLLTVATKTLTAGDIAGLWKKIS